MTTPTPPGWYPMQGDPAGSVRYWDGIQWQGQPQMQQQGAMPVQENLWGLRFAAKLIDGVILMIPWFSYGFIVGVTGADELVTDEGSIFAYEPTTTDILVFTAIYVAYKFLCYQSMGTTLGRKIVGLKIVGNDGSEFTQDKQLKRIAAHGAPNILALIPGIGELFALIFLLYWLIGQPIIAAISPYETLRDKVSQTRVVRA